MGKKIDFVDKAANKETNTTNTTPVNGATETTESVVDELKKLGEGKVPSISELSDEALQLLIGNLGLIDSEGKTIVFQTEDEAIIYSAQLQRNIPQIRFCKIIPCYSILGGKFFVIEPVSTEQANNMTEEELKSPSDLSYVNEIILMAIVESCKRERALTENK